MKMKNQHRIWITIFSLFLLLALPKARADQNSDDQACYNADNEATTDCTTAQQNNDNIAYSTEQTDQANAYTNYLTQVDLDATNQAIAQFNCNTSLWAATGNPNNPQDIGSCGNAAALAEAAAASNYEAAIYNCQLKPTFGCECVAEKTEDFQKAQALNQNQKCANDAQANNSSCVANSGTLKTQQDGDAAAGYTLTNSMAAAAYQQTRDKDFYTCQTCEENADCTASICLYHVDCHYNSNNCCVDDTWIAYDNTMEAACASENGVVGPALGTYDYTTIMCDATQSRADSIANDLEQYTQGMAKNAENLADALASDTEQFSLNQDNNQEISDEGTCNCTLTNENQLTACITAAKAKQGASDAVATTAYQIVANVPPSVPVGSAYDNYENTYMASTNTYDQTIAEDIIIRFFTDYSG